jgi:hypothetical protein
VPSYFLLKEVDALVVLFVSIVWAIIVELHHLDLIRVVNCWYSSGADR